MRIIQSFYRGDGHNVPSAALRAIHEQLEAVASAGGAAVVAGTSAGTDAQTSSIMITGGYSYQGLKYGAQIYDNINDIDSSAERVTAYRPGGLGFFTHGLVDTHYSNRGRQGRTLALLIDSSSRYGFGIDENTALVVTGAIDARVGRVIGERSVVFFDATKASSSSTGQFQRSITNVQASRLTHEDTIDLSTYQVSFASFKSTLDLSDGDLYHSEDIFESDATFEFDLTVDSLLQSNTLSTSYGDSKERFPTYRVSLQRQAGAEARGGLDPSTQKFIISYTNLVISVENM